MRLVVALAWQAAALASLAAAAASLPPHIILLITDDQDLELGGSSAEVMPKLHALLAAQGVSASSFFAHVPVCCPSRSSLYSGQYQHNNGVVGNSLAGNCSSAAWQAGPERRSVATYLQAAGYRTSFAGKYLNTYCAAEAGGVQHVPPGWTSWHGLCGNSVYYNSTLSNTGVAEAHGDDPDEDYLTSVVLNRTLAFVDASAPGAPPRVPLFMVLSTPAPHAYHVALPKYQTAFPGKGAPRTPAFHARSNASTTHWLQAAEGVYGLQPPPSPSSGENSAAFSDLVFRRRWQSLQSVDDILEGILLKMAEIGELDNTFVVYTTDNGLSPSKRTLDRAPTTHPTVNCNTPRHPQSAQPTQVPPWPIRLHLR